MNFLAKALIDKYLEGINVIKRVPTPRALETLAGVNMNNYPRVSYSEDGEKYINNIDITHNSADMNLEGLLNSVGTEMSVPLDDMYIYLDGIREPFKKDSNSEKIISALKRAIGDDRSVEVVGLGYLLADYTTKMFSTPEKVPVDYEIIRTNAEINFDDIGITPPTTTSAGDYIYKMNDHLTPTREELDKVSEKINSLSESLLSVYNRSTRSNRLGVTGTQDVVSIPKWNLPNNSMEQKVRQHNKYYSRKAKYARTVTQMGTEEKNYFEKSTMVRNLSLVLNPGKGVTSWNGDKDGFSKEGYGELMYVTDEYDQSKEMFTDMTRTGLLGSKDSTLSSYDENGKITMHKGLGLGYAYIVPQVLLGHINLKTPQSLEELKEDTTEAYVTARKRVYPMYNSAVKSLLRRIPDFASNMYHCFFTQTSADGRSKTTSLLDMGNNSGENSTLNSNLSNSDAIDKLFDSYYVRLAGIEIAGVEGNSYELNFAGRKLSKVSSEWAEGHTATLEFDLDENGLLLRHFNIISGFPAIDKVNDTDNSTFYQTCITDFNSEYYGRTYFPPSFTHGQDGKSSKIDLTVIYNDFRNSSRESTYKPMMKGISSLDGEQYVYNGHQQKYYGSADAYKAYVLEDVKFLGISSPLKLSRDDGNAVTISVDIVYKRITTLDNNI